MFFFFLTKLNVYNRNGHGLSSSLTCYLSGVNVAAKEMFNCQISRSIALQRSGPECHNISKLIEDKQVK